MITRISAANKYNLQQFNGRFILKVVTTMKFFSSVLFIISTVNIVFPWKLPARDKRQIQFTTPSAVSLTPCDPRAPMCPAEVIMPIDPATKQPIQPSPTCPTPVAPSTTEICADTTKTCCTINSPPPPQGQKTRICVDPAYTKPGKCPPRGNVQRTWNECVWDSNCSGSKKCCGGGNSCSFYSCVTV